MRERLLLGPVLIAALVGGLWLDQRLQGAAGPWGHTLPPGIVIAPLMVLIACLGAIELGVILRAKGVMAARGVLTLGACLGLGVFLLPVGLEGTDQVAAVGAAATVALACSMAFYSRGQNVQGVVGATGGTLLAFVYLGLMFGLVLALRREFTAWHVAWMLLTVKSCDIGAYFTGKSIGRRKLIPWLSPGKTWEGLIGGVLFSTGVGCLGLWILSRDGLQAWAGVGWSLVPGFLFGIAGQAGDLLASLMKRDAGIKDSGRILPGFGGVLDVVDSPILVAPLAFWWLKMMSERVVEAI